MTPDHTDLSRSLQDSVLRSKREFAAAVNDIRPRLHRFCSRMCGSVLDGEDVVQDALADAFYNLASLNDPSRFEPWLFRIAYFRCVDFLRREGKRRNDVALDDEYDVAIPEDEPFNDAPIDEALRALVVELPPKERAAVVLKDVLDYSLEEIAGIADTTLGGAKAALHRGRSKLLSASPHVGAPAPLAADRRRLLDAYAECFNRRDWDGLRTLVRADARLEIVGEKVGVMSGLGATYNGNYTRLPWEWRLSSAVIDGAPAIVHWKRTGDEWQPHAAIRLWFEGDDVVRIRDYVHVGYLMNDAVIDAPEANPGPA